MKKYAALFFFSLFLCQSFSFAEEKENTVFQVSTYQALLEGVLDGQISYKEVKKYGDFGLGTFHALNGEMIALDGDFYQIKSDGTAVLASEELKTPFATVTFFSEDQIIRLDKAFTLDELKKILDPKLPTLNIIYALRIDGTFDYIKVRSPYELKRPYPHLKTIAASLPEFEHHKAEGTIIGFRFPDYLKGINAPDYHFHFITKDRKAGGHVLDWLIKHADIKMDRITDFRMILPETPEFFDAALQEKSK